MNIFQNNFKNLCINTVTKQNQKKALTAIVITYEPSYFISNLQIAMHDEGTRSVIDNKPPLLIRHLSRKW